MKEILAPATRSQPGVRIDCSPVLRGNERITKAFILHGKQASGVVIDCKGALLDGGWRSVNHGRDMIVIRSRKTRQGWERPSNIRIRSCRIRGSIRIYGMGRNGEAREVRRSSRRRGHTARAQAAAPTNITLENLTISAHGRIPLYIAPGVTRVRIRYSRFAGWSISTAIYLDAESAYNTIAYNEFHTHTTREIIAVDGSAHNNIVGNFFTQLDRGGIYLYRNCGEGGTVRHQPPQFNRIIGNAFFYHKFRGWQLSARELPTNGPRMPAIWLGSRNGIRLYCRFDGGYAFGSSVDDRDLAYHNTVAFNRFRWLPVPIAIAGNVSRNNVHSNRTVRQLDNPAASARRNWLAAQGHFPGANRKRR